MALLQLEEIRFAYPRQPLVLDGVSLSLAAGARLSLTGPNGAGKSTLLRVIVGLLPPLSGRLIFEGEERRTEPAFRALRRKIGLVFQDPDDQLFCPTVREDIAFGPLNLGASRDEALAIVDQVLARMHLSHLRDRITHHLSGGEKRLISLASVLAMEPEVLILDEPTNALDPENEARLIEILRALPQAILLVSHDAAFRAEIAPQSVHLSGGKIIA